jgi:hypothetical protein
VNALLPDPNEQVRFLVNVQRLLAEGQFVATYKYALLLALADLAVERGDDSGAQLVIDSRELAEKFIHYYWRHCDPYAPVGASAQHFDVLSQNTGKQAGIVKLVHDAKRRHGASEAEAKRHRREWDQLVSAVTRIVIVMPLWKLQTVGREKLDFLYENTERGSTVILRPGVTFCLRKFHGIVTDLVRGAWVRYVRRFNQRLLGDTTDLHAFLFGSERADLAGVAKILKEVQSDRCFYCERALKGAKPHVDHFVPWSRYPVDLGHNFVLADEACNSRKSDRIPALMHLERWVGQIERSGSALSAAFDGCKVMHDLPTTLRITDWAYRQNQEAAGMTWLRGKELIRLEGDWLPILERLQIN